jgi:hypothetical protein
MKLPFSRACFACVRTSGLIVRWSWLLVWLLGANVRWMWMAARLVIFALLLLPAWVRVLPQYVFSPHVHKGIRYGEHSSPCYSCLPDAASASAGYFVRAWPPTRRSAAGATAFIVFARN